MHGNPTSRDKYLRGASGLCDEEDDEMLEVGLVVRTDRSNRISTSLLG